ncbi:putative carboxylesterase [Talaromyces proteolyticus]|uniref:Carboxylic ester hydrolase n=1 Tax=Talaromyces proteolyticus TaxID=1131652 RepID=A0AAD4L2U1_9EURO|nr:putative carboxylesterase [Talaromyces proteolyticus]KAH8704918.1 putative carboxylesterase [Talaromyces proteolyticus]
MRTVSILGLYALSVAAASPQHTSSSSSVTILFHNDGDWTTHGQKPSALFVSNSSTYDDAVDTCASYGEKLLDCRQFGDFVTELVYQEYIHNANGLLFWSTCSSSAPTDVKGAVVHANADSAKLPFLCTNSAPFVEKIDTDYSTLPRVQTPSIGGISFQGLRDHMAFRFLGIPFAKPPVGDLRFKYAQPVEYIDTKVNATNYGPACLQVGPFDGNSQGLNPWGNSEDCLHLQVFTPSLPVGGVPSKKDLKPVMLWIHGGGMVNGAGSDSTFDGDSLVSRGDVVLVAINYRLNIFGLLSLDDTIPGNYDMSDKIVALKWVKKYITAFGGDPDNITIFGQSAGAASVMSLVVSPNAKGLFHNAIAQSIGGFVKNRTVAAGEVSPYLQPLCHNSTGEVRLKCLQAIPAETLLNISTRSSWQTVIDNNYMPAQPVSLVSRGDINAVNLILGFMPEEAQSLLETASAPDATNFNDSLATLIAARSINQSQANAISSSGLWDVPQHYPSVYNATINLATDTVILCYSTEFIEAGSSPVGNPNAFTSLWVYEHQRAYALPFYSFYGLCSFPIGKPNTPYYRCHSGDLFEVFGTYYLFDQPVRVVEDIYYTNAVQDMWTAFAKSGNPNPEEAYLAVRGYNSSQEVFRTFKMKEYSKKEGQLAKLQWPRPWYASLPDQEHCHVLGMEY